MSRSYKLPGPFWVTWVVEFWERFGYYSVSHILPLYFIHNLHYTQAESMMLYGAFVAFIFGFIYIGGWLGDHVIGAKRMILIGAITLALAYGFLAFSTNSTVYYALALIVVGNMLFKANPSSLISKIFDQGQQQKELDAAMTLYYMAINIGSFISTLITPLVAVTYGYGPAFFVACIGLIIGTFSYILFYNKLAAIATPAGSLPLVVSRLWLLIGGIIAATILIGFLLQHPHVVNILVWIIVLAGVVSFATLSFRYASNERNKMLTALLLIVCAVFFFSLYHQMPTSLTFLVLNSVDRSVFGFEIPAAAYQAMNPFFIIVMSVFLSRFIYPYMSISYPQKFALGFLLSAIAFGLMFFIKFFNNGAGEISNWFLVLNYFFQAVGELFISALGLAMIAELCPRAISGFSMGIFFLSSMLAGPVSAWIGTFTTSAENLSTQQHLTLYANTFGSLGLVALGFALVLWLLSQKLNKIIGHIHPNDQDLIDNT